MRASRIPMSNQWYYFLSMWQFLAVTSSRIEIAGQPSPWAGTEYLSRHGLRKYLILGCYDPLRLLPLHRLPALECLDNVDIVSD